MVGFISGWLVVSFISGWLVVGFISGWLMVGIISEWLVVGFISGWLMVGFISGSNNPPLFSYCDTNLYHLIRALYFNRLQKIAKESSICHKLWCSKTYIFATLSLRP